MGISEGISEVVSELETDCVGVGTTEDDCNIYGTGLDSVGMIELVCKLGSLFISVGGILVLVVFLFFS